MNAFTLHSPWWLLMLLPLVALLLWSLNRQRNSALLYSSTSLVQTLPTTLALRWKRFLPALQLLGLALIVVALARPQQGEEEFRIRSEGIAMVLAIDRSGSMEALDFTPRADLNDDSKWVTRLGVAKGVMEEFIAGSDELAGRPDDLIGLVEFGGFAQGRCPLTLDHGALLELLRGVEIPQPIRNEAGEVLNTQLWEEERQTAIGDALALCVERLKDHEAESRVVILLSDGENTAGLIEPLEAADLAKEFGIRVYTVGIGSTGRALARGRDSLGRQRLTRMPVVLDEVTLQAIAERTDGRYFSARNQDALREVYATIDELEKTELESLVYTRYREIYGYLLFPGLALLLLSIVLRATRFRSLP